MDSRPSDAIALAVRVEAPIYAEEGVLDRAGILLDQETGKLLSETSQTDKIDGKRISEEEMKKLSAYQEFINSLDMEDFDKRKS